MGVENRIIEIEWVKNRLLRMQALVMNRDVMIL
jgi:hypothetical protein